MKFLFNGETYDTDKHLFVVGRTYDKVSWYSYHKGDSFYESNATIKCKKGTIIETNYPAFTVPRGFKCRNNREINDTHTNLITSIYCSKPSSITSPVESKRTELRALR